MHILRVQEVPGRDRFRRPKVPGGFAKEGPHACGGSGGGWGSGAAHLYMFYVFWWLWEAHVYVLYVAGKFGGGTDSGYV